MRILLLLLLTTNLYSLTPRNLSMPHRGNLQKSYQVLEIVHGTYVGPKHFGKIVEKWFVNQISIIDNVTTVIMFEDGDIRQYRLYNVRYTVQTTKQFKDELLDRMSRKLDMNKILFPENKTKQSIKSKQKQNTKLRKKQLNEITNIGV